MGTSGDNGMRMRPQRQIKRHTDCSSIGLFVVWFFLCGIAACAVNTCVAAVGTRPAKTVDESLESIVCLIEKGHWAQAEALVKKQPGDANECLQPINEILTQYHTLQQRRQGKQQEIYAERYGKLLALFDRHAAGDPNATDQAVFMQANAVWKDATKDQQADLLRQARFQTLLDAAYEKGVESYQAGKWRQARVKSIKWLTAFNPDRAEYKALAEQLRQVDAVTALLRKDPCDEANLRYTTVEPVTIASIFQILQAAYVEPVDFYAMARVMVDRCVIVGDVMKTQSKNSAYQADPNDCDAWKKHLVQLSAELQAPPVNDFDIRDFFSVQDLVLMVNEETLRLPQGVMLSLMAEAALTELDSYTKVVWPSGVRDFEKLMMGQFGGVGFRVAKEKDAIKVLSLIPNTPAARSCLRVDMKILAVDGESTEAMSILCAVRKISGPIGTSVTLTIQYPDSDQEEFADNRSRQNRCSDRGGIPAGRQRQGRQE